MRSHCCCCFGSSDPAVPQLLARSSISTPFRSLLRLLLTSALLGLPNADKGQRSPARFAAAGEAPDTNNHAGGFPASDVTFKLLSSVKDIEAGGVQLATKSELRSAQPIRVPIRRHLPAATDSGSYSLTDKEGRVLERDGGATPASHALFLQGVHKTAHEANGGCDGNIAGLLGAADSNSTEDTAHTVVTLSRGGSQPTARGPASRQRLSHSQPAAESRATPAGVIEEIPAGCKNCEATPFAAEHEQIATPRHGGVQPAQALTVSGSAASLAAIRDLKEPAVHQQSGRRAGDRLSPFQLPFMPADKNVTALQTRQEARLQEKAKGDSDDDDGESAAEDSPETARSDADDTVTVRTETRPARRGVPRAGSGDSERTRGRMRAPSGERTSSRRHGSPANQSSAAAPTEAGKPRSAPASNALEGSEPTDKSGHSGTSGDTPEDGAWARPKLSTDAMSSKSTQTPESSENWSESAWKSAALAGGRSLPGVPEMEAAYKTAASPETVTALEARREKQRQEQEQRAATDMETIYKKASSAVPAANYLGAGYDPVKGNPIGDPVMMGDPGLRAPVIRLEYKQTPDGVSNDLSTLQPVGGFVRPYVACKQSETVCEINSLHDYQKELSADASLQGGDLIGANSFSASAGYKDMAKEVSSKVNKSFMIKTYCIRYEAGLAQSSNVKWEPTLAFSAAVEQLPTEFDGKKPECACTPDQWRQDHTVDACRSSNIPLWFSFFDQFGTTYITRLFAGGKMTYQVTVDASEARKAKKRGVDVAAQIKLQLGVGSGGGSTKTKSKSESNIQKNELNIAKETLIIGGRPPANVSDPSALATWADTVEQLPMPVKIEVQSLQGLLPEEKQHAFADATAYYAKAVGMSLQDLNLLNGEVKSLTQLLQEAAQVAWAGAAPGFAKCPPGKVVLAGFAAHLSFLAKSLANYHISACTSGREKCDGVGASTSDQDDERIYMICGDESINELQQVVAESTPGMNEAGMVLEAACPEGTVALGGFGFSYGADRAGLEVFDIEACRTGQTTCTKSPSPHSAKSFIWLLCVDPQFPGARNLRNAVALGTVGKANKDSDNDGEVTVRCPEKTTIVQGLVMEAHTSLDLVRDRYSHCKGGLAKCSMTGKGIENGGLLKYDYHALFGWCLCTTGVEPAAHVASDSHRKARIRMQSVTKRGASTTGDVLVADTDVHPQDKSRPPPRPPPPRRGRRQTASGSKSAQDSNSTTASRDTTSGTTSADGSTTGVPPVPDTEMQSQAASPGPPPPLPRSRRTTPGNESAPNSASPAKADGAASGSIRNDGSTNDSARAGHGDVRVQDASPLPPGLPPPRPNSRRRRRQVVPHSDSAPDTTSTPEAADARGASQPAGTRGNDSSSDDGDSTNGKDESSHGYGDAANALHSEF